MSNSATNSRLEFIVCAQTIGCLLVIFGHSYPFQANYPGRMSSIQAFIYCFHMPLFIFISGYLLSKTGSLEKYGYKKYILKRAKKLFIPYVVLSVVGIAPKFIFSGYINDNAELSVNYFVRCFLVPRENIWGHFWFLPTIFIMALLSFVFVYAKKHSKWLLTFLVIITFGISLIDNVTQWFALSDVIRNVFYYSLGIAFANSKFENLILTKKYSYVGLILFPLSIIAFIPNISSYLILTIRSNCIGVMMIFFVICISNLFRFERIPIIHQISNKTYSVFILSWPFQCAVEIVLERMLSLNWYVIMPSMFISGIICPLIVIKTVDIIERKIGKKFISPVIGG